MSKYTIILAAVLFASVAVTKGSSIARQIVDSTNEQHELITGMKSQIERINENAQQEVKTLNSEVEKLGRVSGPKIRVISEKIKAGIKKIENGKDFLHCKKDAQAPQKKFDDAIDKMHRCMFKALEPVFDMTIIENKSYNDGVARLDRINQKIDSCPFDQSFSAGSECIRKIGKESKSATDEITSTLNSEIAEYKRLAGHVRSHIKVCNPDVTLQSIYREISSTIEEFERCVGQ